MHAEKHKVPLDYLRAVNTEGSVYILKSNCRLSKLPSQVKYSPTASFQRLEFIMAEHLLVHAK